MFLECEKKVQNPYRRIGAGPGHRHNREKPFDLQPGHRKSSPNNCNQGYLPKERAGSRDPSPGSPARTELLAHYLASSLSGISSIDGSYGSRKSHQ